MSPFERLITLPTAERLATIGQLAAGIGANNRPPKRRRVEAMTSPPRTTLRTIVLDPSDRGATCKIVVPDAAA
jgi:hypothetical protein